LNRFYNLLIHFVFVILFTVGTSFSTLADVFYPKYNNNSVIDLSGRLDPNYISKLETDISKAPMEIRLVYIYAENKINLGIYAAKLYDNWQMNGDSILVVIDPVTNEVGYGISLQTKNKLKQRKETIVENKNKKVDKGLTEDLSDVEPETLVSSIIDKFTRKEILIGSDNSNKENKDNKRAKGPGSTMNLIMDKVGLSDKHSNTPRKTRPLDLPIFKILIMFAFLAFIILLAKLYVFRLKKIKIKELKETYSFDGTILIKSMNENIEKILGDIERMNKFRGKTKEFIDNHISKLQLSKEEARKDLEKLNKILENIEDVEEVGTLLGDSDLLNKGLEALHKESVEYRKEFRLVLKKSNSSISDLRVNIENCKSVVEETKRLYKLELTQIVHKIKHIENEIPSLENYVNSYDPVGFTEYLGTVKQKIKDIRKEIEIIPHLHKQIQENVPKTMTNYLKHSFFMINIFERERIRQELFELRAEALSVLSTGDLKASEEIVNSIFEILNSEPKQPENSENSQQSSIFDNPE